MDAKGLALHARGMRALARSLLRDEAQVEDVLQEATLAALREREERGRGWWVRVVRNLALRQRRSDRRRARREHAAARPEPGPSTAEVVERAEVHRRLVRAVLGLEEPYRSSLLLRYFDELPLKEVSQRLGVPVGTVSARVHRGLQLLRGRLAGPKGNRDWRPALLPLAGFIPSRFEPVLPGVIVMSTKKALVVVAVLVVLAAGWISWQAFQDEDQTGDRTGEAATTTDPEPKTPAVKEKVRFHPPVDFARVDRDLDLHGEVVDEEGAPVPGAVVATFWHPWRRASTLNRKEDRLEELGPVTAAAQDGTFKLRLRRGQRVNLRVEAAGFARAERAFCQAGERVRIVMSNGVGLAVTVVDDSGSPVPGTRLRLFRPARTGSDWIEREAIADAEGRHTFTGLPPGVWAYLDPRHPDRGSTVWEEVNTPLAGVREVRVVMPPSRVLRGIVTDAKTKKPIAGARVGAGWTFAVPVTTDEKGAFRYPGWTGSGRSQLHAVADGYAPAKQIVVQQEVVNFALIRGNVVKGRLLLPSGKPADGAILSVLSSNSKNHGRTDREGRFEIGGLAHGVPASLVVFAEGAGRMLLDFDPPAEQPGTVNLGDVTLPVARRIEGQILAPDGRPAAGVLVELTGANHDRTRLRPGFAPTGASFWGTQELRRTDDLGRFRFSELAPGTYALAAQPGGARWVSQSCELGAEADQTGVLIQLVGSHTFTGRVRDEEGAALPGILVSARTQSGESMGYRTNGRGEARFLTEHPIVAIESAYEFRTMPRVLPAEPMTIEAGTQEADIVLRRCGRAVGRVLDEKGRAYAQAEIRVTVDGKPLRANFYAVGTIQSDLHGRFEVPIPKGKKVDLLLTGYSYATPENRGEDFTGELRGVGEGEQVVLRAKAPTLDRTLRVRVLAPDGTPLPRAQVWARRRGKLVPGANVWSNKEGRASLQKLPNAPVRVWAKVHPEHPRATVWTKGFSDVVVPRGQEVEIQLREGIWITGTVLDENGKRAGGASVQLLADGQLLRFAQSDESGDFEILIRAGVKGKLRLHASRWSPTGHLRSVTTPEIDPEAGPFMLFLK